MLMYGSRSYHPGTPEARQQMPITGELLRDTLLERTARHTKDRPSGLGSPLLTRRGLRVP
jgi:hypothetical protein